MLGDASGVIPLLLPLIYFVAVDSVFAILLLFQLAALFAFFALLAAIAHNSLLHSAYEKQIRRSRQREALAEQGQRLGGRRDGAF